MRFYVYATKGDRLYADYREGSHTGPLVSFLRSCGWTVYYRKAKPI